MPRLQIKNIVVRSVQCGSAKTLKGTKTVSEIWAVLIITIGTAFFSLSCKTWFHSRLPGGQPLYPRRRPSPSDRIRRQGDIHAALNDQLIVDMADDKTVGQRPHDHEDVS